MPARFLSISAALGLAFALNIVSPSVLLAAETAPALGQDIAPNTSGYYGHGFILGRPVRGTLDGGFFPTWELTVNQGGFTDSNFYIGSNVGLSTEIEEIFNQFQTLNADHLYVFEYIDKHPLNPEIEDSHLQIVKIYTAAEFIAKFPEYKDLESVASPKPYSGSGGDGVRKGRIVDLERYGTLGSFCLIELNTGGLSEQGESLMGLTVMDEGVCRWVEARIALAKDVTVTYSRDMFEIWQPSTYFANKIEIVETGESMVVPKDYNAIYEGIKTQLLKDPVFLNLLQEKFNQLREKHKQP